MLSQQYLVIWDKKRSPEIRILFLAELTEKEGFEPSRRFNTTYTLSRGASSAS